MALIGFVTGALARLLVPGRDPMNWWQTMLLGVIGSFVGGFVFALFPGGRSPLDFGPSSIIPAIIGAVLVLLAWRRIRAT